MATFALGTAAGDMTADAMHLGFLMSGFMFIGLIAVPALDYWMFGLNEIFAFWFAYIITRPLGASFADWMTSPSFRGGLGLNQFAVSLVLVAIIAALVIYMRITHLDIKNVNNEKDRGRIRTTRA